MLLPDGFAFFIFAIPMPMAVISGEPETAPPT